MALSKESVGDLAKLGAAVGKFCGCSKPMGLLCLISTPDKADISCVSAVTGLVTEAEEEGIASADEVLLVVDCKSKS